MANKAKPPKLFDVLPSALLRQSLAGALPDGTTCVWERVGSIRVTGQGLAALDAGSCHPRYLAGEATRLEWPYSSADLAVRFAQQPDGTRSRVLAVLVAAPAGELPGRFSACEWELAGAMSIDSATGVVGDYARLLTECRAGGPRAVVLVGKGAATSAEQKKTRQRAAARGGYRVEFPSGDQETVKENDLIPVPNQHVFRTGDAVRAVWSNAAMYSGRISGVSPVGYVVAWDDGSAPEIVPLGALTFLDWT
jgi:hypothetical protein